ncbi:TetR/AcrR family transcriptional regulator [Maribellus sp. CM-23]|uniref:TetR/AcrR family transcriptional regulator n=1 Tax=Maribellus sp. CM-23 TaxID=2781026 RepID=UPI001F44BA42|nr:TetR/AcrR family transcriptional regulator [Maribellus sp. CM-23]MCE4565773.1 TetR/AcrR family transcriptional regulator [Maribellus sp. CM-23]
MNDLKKDNTEEKILNAAQNVFIEKGMDGARMQAIADEAGINKALLHYYFRTKEKLFNAIFTKVFSQIFPNLMTMVRSERPLEEKLGMFVETYIDLLQKNPFLPTFILKEMNRNPDFLAKIIKGSGVNPTEVIAMFEKEMDAGKIRRMDPRDILVNILGLSIFPIAAGPLITIMFFENDKAAYKAFIERRKKTVTEFVLNSILIK